MTKKPASSLFIADRRAVAAVEFAIIVPVFMMLLIGIFAYGSYLSVVHGVQQLTAEAARASIAGVTDSERVSLAQANIAGNIGGYPFLIANDLVVQSAGTNGTGTFSVTVRYDAADMFIFNLPALIPMPSPVIVRTAAIQRGGY